MLDRYKRLLACLTSALLVAVSAPATAHTSAERHRSSGAAQGEHKKSKKPKKSKGNKGHGKKKGQGKKPKKNAAKNHKNKNKNKKSKKNKSKKHDKRKSGSRRKPVSRSRAIRLDRRTPARSLPVPHGVVTERDLKRPHHDYPAWDVGLRRGTRVLAMRAGRVTKVTKRGACGRGVVMRGKDGFTYTYCHGQHVKVKKKEAVDAGETIMRSGNSGRSTGPHLHLQIKSPGGRLRCPQKLLRAEWRGRSIPTKAAPSRGCSY